MSSSSVDRSEENEVGPGYECYVDLDQYLAPPAMLFTQTGLALYPEYESITLLIQRSVRMVRSHPGARDVKS